MIIIIIIMTLHCSVLSSDFFQKNSFRRCNTWRRLHDIKTDIKKSLFCIMSLCFDGHDLYINIFIYVYIYSIRFAQKIYACVFAVQRAVRMWSAALRIITP